MQKRAGVSNKIICLSEVFLLISFSFALAFIFSENSVSGAVDLGNGVTFIGQSESSDLFYYNGPNGPFTSMLAPDDIKAGVSVSGRAVAPATPPAPSAATTPTQAGTRFLPSGIAAKETATFQVGSFDKAVPGIPSNTEGVFIKQGGSETFLSGNDAYSITRGTDGSIISGKVIPGFDATSIANKLPANAPVDVLERAGYKFNAASENIPIYDGTKTYGLTSSDGTRMIVDNKVYEKATDSVTGNSAWVQAGTAPTPEKTSLFGLEIASGGFAHLVNGLLFASAVVGMIQLFAPMLGADASLTKSLSLAAFGGIMTYKALTSLGATGFGGPGGFSSGFAQSGIGSYVTGGVSKLWPGLIGLGVAVAIFLATYKKEKKQLVSFQCLPFEPATGGAKCEECNKDPFRPCSEYRCKSLGQACDIINPGSAEEKCVWVNPKDVNSPIIQTWDSALKPTGLSYTPDNAIRPPNRGVKIIDKKSKDGCLQAFTPLEFGITLNEPAQCKLDFNSNASFDEMQYYFGESNFLRYNHTEKMKLPGPEQNVEGVSPLLQNDGTFSLYARCKDANGNYNVDAFVFNFCVNQGPDTTPPVIERTSITSGSPVTFDIQQVPIQVYTNEPSECKWSRIDKDYADMENSMTCTTESFQVNADLQYTCAGNLTGIKNQEDNKFFFRCRDQPGKIDSERNTNEESYPLILKGTQKLNIVGATPNNQTIFSSTDIATVDLKLETDDGANEGKAVCYFSGTGSIDSYISMFSTNSHTHSQSLDLGAGNYNYYFRCIDDGGNAADANISFNVFIDRTPPKVTRAYREQDLKIVTDEDSECVYSLQSCNYVFGEGIKMIFANADNKKNHFTQWKNSATYYVKCKDKYDNEPAPNSCSIVASASRISQEA